MLLKLRTQVAKTSLPILQTFLLTFSMPATKFFSIWKKYLVKRNFQLFWAVYLRKTYKKGRSEKMRKKKQEEIILNENVGDIEYSHFEINNQLCFIYFVSYLVSLHFQKSSEQSNVKNYLDLTTRRSGVFYL